MHDVSQTRTQDNDELIIREGTALSKKRGSNLDTPALKSACRIYKETQVLPESNREGNRY